MEICNKKQIKKVSFLVYNTKRNLFATSRNAYKKEFYVESIAYQSVSRLSKCSMNLRENMIT